MTTQNEDIDYVENFIERMNNGEFIFTAKATELK
jgi:hypothetical protein